jgi:hypothetical protein
MSYPMLRHVVRHARQLTPAGWFWCAVGLVVGCDTNVLARLVAGQVAYLLNQRPDLPAGNDEREDDPDASETPTWPAGPSACRPSSGGEDVPSPALPLSAAAANRPGLAALLWGIRHPPLPIYGGTALPLRC